MNKRYGQGGNEKKKAFQYTMVTVNDLIDSPYQINAFCLIKVPSAMLRFYSTSLFNKRPHPHPHPPPPMTVTPKY